MQTDITIVATRRPELLRQMIGSFSKNVFPKLDIGHVYANVDPAFGSKDDQAEAVHIIRQRFPAATVFEPETPGFAAAVVRVWAATSSPFVLHLEEDWLAVKDAGDFCAPFGHHPKLAQVVLSMPFQEKRLGIRRKFKSRRLIGLTVPFTRKPCNHIGTSPGLFRGSFCREAARIMDPALDPEKQFCGGRNAPLERYARGFDSFIHSPDGDYVLADLGRDWMKAHGRRKQIINGVVTWPEI